MCRFVDRGAGAFALDLVEEAMDDEELEMDVEPVWLDERA